MAATTVSSSIITNTKGNQITYNDLGADGDGKARKIVGSVEVATTSLDEVGDVVLLCPLRGNQRVTSIKLYNDDLDSNGSPLLTADIGIYKDVSDDGTDATVVDADAYASAITALQAAVTAGTEVAFEARDIAKMGQTVAEDGGESAHNKVRYLGITVAAAAGTAAAGTVAWEVTVVEA